MPNRSDVTAPSLAPNDEFALPAVLAQVRAGITANQNVNIVINRSQRRKHSIVSDARVDELGKPACEIVVKTYRPTSNCSVERARDRVKTEYAILKELENPRSACQGLRTVSPLLCLPDVLTIVTRKSDGENLQSLLKREARVFPRGNEISRVVMLAAACGRWLMNFQRITRVDAYPLDLSGVIDEIDHLVRVCESQLWWSSPRLRNQIVSYCHAGRERITSADLIVSGIHGDYFAGNILAHGSDVTVLDFEMFRYGSVWVDVTYFLHQLQTLLLKPIFRRRVVSEAATAFLAGYGVGLPEECLRQNRVFNMFSILHIVRRLADSAGNGGTTRAKRWYERRMARIHMRHLHDKTREA